MILSRAISLFQVFFQSIFLYCALSLSLFCVLLPSFTWSPILASQWLLD